MLGQRKTGGIRCPAIPEAGRVEVFVLGRRESLISCGFKCPGYKYMGDSKIVEIM